MESKANFTYIPCRKEEENKIKDEYEIPQSKINYKAGMKRSRLSDKYEIPQSKIIYKARKCKITKAESELIEVSFRIFEIENM